MAAQMTSSATRYEPKMLHAVKSMAKNDVHRYFILNYIKRGNGK